MINTYQYYFVLGEGVVTPKLYVTLGSVIWNTSPELTYDGHWYFCIMRYRHLQLWFSHLKMKSSLLGIFVYEIDQKST